MERQPQNIIQTVVSDQLARPEIIGRLLVGVWFLMGICVAMLVVVAYGQTLLERELRIMQVHMENTNAILIREGLEKPGDREGTGPTKGSQK